MLWGGLDKGSQEFIAEIRGWCQWHLHLSLCQFKRVKRVHSSSDGGRVMGVCLSTKGQMIHKSSLLSSEDSVNGLRLHSAHMWYLFVSSQELKSEDSVDGVDDPIADWQIKIHHKSLIVQPRLKKVIFSSQLMIKDLNFYISLELLQRRMWEVKKTSI